MSTQIVLYANNPLKLYSENRFYVVEKGEVNIFAVLKDGRKEFLTSFKNGELFFTLQNFKNESFYLEAHAGSIEPVVHKSDKKADIKDITKSLNKFERFIDLQYDEPIDTESLNKLFKEFEKSLNQYFFKKQEKELSTLNNKISTNHKLTKQAVINLGSVVDENLLDENLLDVSDDILISTIKVVCKNLDIEMGTIDKESLGDEDPVYEISKTLNLRVRQVNLKAGWHKNDNGVLLGFTKELTPVALIPNETTSYFMINLLTNTKVVVDKENVKSILSKGYMFYRPLPQKRLELLDILKFISTSNHRDIFQVLIASILVGLIALATPLATGKLFDEIIPASDKIQAYEILYVLLIAGFSTAIFQSLRGFSTARLKSKIGLNLEAAIWDRLINLPTSFFRKYSTGDLALRADGINEIQDILSGTIISSILSGIFSIFSFLLLFKYSLKLAFIGLALVLFAVTVNIVFMFIQVRYQAKIVKVSADVSSFLFELISGIQKLKIANAVNRAYAKWAKQYSAQSRLVYDAGFIQNYLEVFNSVFRLFVSIVIYASITFFLKEDKDFSTGEFIAFSAAFSQFLVASLSMSSSLLEVLNLQPIYDRIKPIFHELPEVQAHKKKPGVLDGNIEIHNLSFSYEADSDKVLDDISLTIKSGEFVAIVGSSGSGKSTLLRLLLGFEKPTKGNIFYTNQNLQDIDVRSVRSQLGVVLQNGTVMAGDIYTNIVGATNKTIDEAWAVAKMAGLDKDIEQMPMGMHTIVPDGGATLSGGQQQRLLIARALINNPKIIFFDEATSALDNKTQDIVSKSLDALDVTRVVIAHRLSTIIHADKILVLEKGKITQSGTYDELMNEEGLFKELALRQIS